MDHLISSMRQRVKNILFPVIAVLLLVAFLLFMVIRPGSFRKRTENKSHQPSLTTKIPQFRKDGTLQFFPNSGRDTVTINIEVVKSENEIMRGLMYRPEMPQNDGMLFVFPKEEKRTFWMKNTYISLDIIYVDADKTKDGAE